MKQYIANLIVEAKIKFKFHYVQMKQEFRNYFVLKVKEV